MSGSTTPALKVSTWNCRGLNNKYFELKTFLSQYDIDILLATETKLATGINFAMPGYSVYRADHPSGRRKGGSLILIRCKIKHDELPALIEDEQQVARIQIYLNRTPYLIGSYYSAPQNRLNEVHYNTILNSLGSHFLLGGDYNAKHPRWASNIANPRGRLLHDVAFRHQIEFMFPIEPTYYPSNGGVPDTLDFFLGKNAELLCSYPEVLYELSSDHYPVITTISEQYDFLRKSTKLLRKPFDWNVYRSIIDSSLNPSIRLKEPRDIDMAVCTLTRAIQSAAQHAHTNRGRNVSQSL
ncbi:Hypothetical protein NTJ_05096 [Nesidiocoris tenuis]|uniref:Endonuclease/exonuclease/phosphatase domain-containing protein n=1 Tax=Nesidiocoris tenuis TaxID=355587 RepID=A0ABN7AK03_9HEMI|nr:Hypothetical protein NTJ_05096 [Nesidiocoris tenuis]